MKINKGILSVLTVLGVWSLAGCGIGVDSNDDGKAQLIRDQKALNEKFSRVTGTYEGAIALKDEKGTQLPATLYMFAVDVPDGTLPDGTQKLRPTLRARIRIRKILSDVNRMTMVGDFTDSGAISLTSASLPGGTSGGAAGGGGSSGGTSSGQNSAGDFIELQGVAGGDRLQVEVTRNNGLWGTFNARRVSTESIAPAAGEAAQDRQDRAEIFAQLKRTYSGYVTNSWGDRKPVVITVFEIQKDGLPSLNAQFEAPTEVTGLKTVMNVDYYNSLTSEITMRSTEKQSFDISISGSVVNGTLKAEVTFLQHPTNPYNGHFQGVGASR